MLRFVLRRVLLAVPSLFGLLVLDLLPDPRGAG